MTPWLTIRPSTTLLPYTTFFRSHLRHLRLGGDARRHGRGGVRAPPARTRAAAALSGLGLSAGSGALHPDRKSTRLNSSHGYISYAVFCLNKQTHFDFPIGHRKRR